MTNTQSCSEVVLKVDTVGRVRTPKEKQDAMVAAYAGSGMTGQQFAAFCGVKYSTLMSWAGKARRANRASVGMGKPGGMSWVEATIEPEGRVNGEGLSITIGSVVRLEVFNSRQAALAGEVIRSLGEARPCWVFPGACGCSWRWSRATCARATRGCRRWPGRFWART